MIKFTILLVSAITFNFIVSYGKFAMTDKVTDGQEFNLDFSKNPIGFESGQPIYPIDTKIFLKSTLAEEFIISINGGPEKNLTGSKIDISEYIKPVSDTYTVVVDLVGKDSTTHKVFGFTLK